MTRHEKKRAELPTEVVGLEYPSKKLLLIDATGLVDVNFLSGLMHGVCCKTNHSDVPRDLLLSRMVQTSGLKYVITWSSGNAVCMIHAQHLLKGLHNDRPRDLAPR